MLPSSTGNEQTFTFNLSSDSGSNYNVTKTTTLFDAYERENDASKGLNYVASQDLAQGTGFQNLTPEVELGQDDDASSCGELFLFNPSSTTFCKTLYVERKSYELLFSNMVNKFFYCWVWKHHKCNKWCSI